MATFDCIARISWRQLISAVVPVATGWNEALQVPLARLFNAPHCSSSSADVPFVRTIIPPPPHSSPHSTMSGIFQYCNNLTDPITTPPWPHPTNELVESLPLLVDGNHSIRRCVLAQPEPAHHPPAPIVVVVVVVVVGPASSQNWASRRRRRYWRSAAESKANEERPKSWLVFFFSLFRGLSFFFFPFFSRPFPFYFCFPVFFFGFSRIDTSLISVFFDFVAD